MPTFTMKRMAAEGAWMPAVGNVATVMCFSICLILSVNLTGGLFLLAYCYLTRILILLLDLVISKEIFLLLLLFLPI